METAIERAIDAAGGLSALASALGIKPQVINNWRTRGVPATRAIAIEQAIGGAVSRHELCPEIYPREAA